MQQNTTTPKHVILGTGAVGKAIMRELLSRGERIRMVNRSGKADVPSGVEVVKADLYNPREARDVIQGAEVAYQASQPGYTEWQEKFPPLQASILDAASATGVKLVIVDNLYMYGDVDVPLKEKLPYIAETKKGKVRAQMARDALAAHQAGKVRVTLGRASDFFGTEALNSALGERFFIPLLKGKAAEVYVNADVPHSYTYIDDYGKALAILGEREEALGRAWHVPSAPAITSREIVQIAAQAAGIPPKMNVLGPMMARIGGLFIPEAREMLEMLYEFKKPFIVDDSDFRATFRMEPTPMREALEQTVAWYQEHLAEPAKA
jgi:nucleoside-diphosphate-sugar epimerase